jgi:hypothetical protein
MIRFACSAERRVRWVIIFRDIYVASKCEESMLLYLFHGIDRVGMFPSPGKHFLFMNQLRPGMT